MAEDLRDPDHMPPLSRAIPLALQHVLAMFASNVAPAIIVATAAGFGQGTPDAGAMVYLIQMAMLFAGVATLLQTVGFGPVGARLPVVQGTSFAFIPILLPLVAGQGVEAMAAVTGGVLAGGLFHTALGAVIGRVRFALPPLVTGLVVLMIGLMLVPVGIQYAAGGLGAPDYGGARGWAVALVVVAVTLGASFLGRGLWQVSAVLVGLVAGYLLAFALGRVDLSALGPAGWLAVPVPFRFGVAFPAAAVIGFCLMSLIAAIETMGDVCAIARNGAGREATDREIAGATYADGLGTAITGLFGGLPNTSFSQNVGLVAMTGVVSRHVVSLGALVLILCGLVPKVGALVGSVPIEVLGGGVIVMFGMVCAAGISMLAEVDWSRRNMMIFAVALAFGLGLKLEPLALQHLPATAFVLMTSGVFPAALIAIALNLVLPNRSP